jgi:hypothetical protein
LAFAQAGYPLKAGETINGFVFRLLASPDSNFSVDKVMADFYKSDYFKGTGNNPIRRVGF